MRIINEVHICSVSEHKAKIMGNKFKYFHEARAESNGFRAIAELEREGLIKVVRHTTRTQPVTGNKIHTWVFTKEDGR